MKECYSLLASLGINESVCPGVAEFKKLACDFVRKGEPNSGIILLPEAEKKLVYKFSTRNKPQVILKPLT
jgi:hypothetical protein